MPVAKECGIQSESRQARIATWRAASCQTTLSALTDHQRLARTFLPLVATTSFICDSARSLIVRDDATVRSLAQQHAICDLCHRRLKRKHISDIRRDALHMSMSTRARLTTTGKMDVPVNGLQIRARPRPLETFCILPARTQRKHDRQLRPSTFSLRQCHPTDVHACQSLPKCRPYGPSCRYECRAQYDRTSATDYMQIEQQLILLDIKAPLRVLTALLAVFLFAMFTAVPVYQALVITSAARDQVPNSAVEIQRHYDRAVQAMRPMTSSYCQAAIPTAAEYKHPTIPGVASLQLDTVLLFARHGDRAPDHVLIDDLSGNVSWDCDAIGSMTMPESNLVVDKVSDALFETWAPRTFKGTCALGDLTAKGRAMHVDFGQQMRAIYVEHLGLLSRRLAPNELHLRSTDTGRTMSSSLSFLDGLYPHGTHHRNQRVAIRTLSHPVDTMNLYGIEQQCPKLAQLKALAKDHPMWEQIMNATATSRVQVATIAPEDGVEPVVDASKLGVPAQIDSLMCRRCWGKPQPCAPGAGCMPEATVDDGWLVKSLTYWYRDNYFPNRVQPEIVPLAVGPLFREILGILDGTTSHRSNRKAKLHVFMGHDGTLSGMLGALRAAPEEHQWPAYRSNHIVEVWSGVEKGVRRKFVRILINGRPLVTDPDLVGDERRPWCRFGGEYGETCPLDAFIAFLQEHSVEEWSEACKV
ncbi:hypothetical protein AMAG_11659 [Allomyces macrogynus ATCC 38327]|uniref:Histidine acid phosphatase n=1 Tax=Allomyces macrogynus (strain ATCC 38327) TaxID=578462 RepID=A0A0L0SVD1_ALLM3|nr:hypothetical protein AMAG_11659 [Allomyces macrogynus ATCC 38327]|eukprot:KNE66528.1 hypothetical protein AMAG_11659 [Allomyces macrogynus ATCC 38327]